MFPIQTNVEIILQTHFPCAKDELIYSAAEKINKLYLKKENKDIKRWIPNFRYGMYPNEKFFICPDCNEQSMEFGQYCPNCGTKKDIS